jgi:ParB-like chromosome segregation protein Spo0J
MPMLSLDLLEAHPDNANVMSEALRARLAANIRETGRHPPLIVRRSPHDPARYQILDGHHRALVLRDLGYDQTQCEVWDVDDAQADLLLLTLNRLEGSDDPRRRGALLKRVLARCDMQEAVRRLPDDAQRIRSLVAATQPPPAPQPPPKLDDMPQAVTFFLSGVQVRTLRARLRAVDADRSAALVKLLELDAADA